MATDNKYFSPLPNEFHEPDIWKELASHPQSMLLYAHIVWMVNRWGKFYDGWVYGADSKMAENCYMSVSTLKRCKAKLTDLRIVETKIGYYPDTHNKTPDQRVTWYRINRLNDI